jgi:two-component system, NarL family, nitrate/nitrite response regulator NarL
MALESPSHIRVMVVAEHAMFLHGITRLIDDERPQLGVVAAAGSCASAVDAAEEAKPDVILLDVDLIADHEADVVPSLVNGRGTRVLILGGTRDRTMHETAILRGAFGVVQKSDTPETLIKAIKKVHEGQLWLDRSTTGRLFVELSKQKSRAVADPATRKLASLTHREQEVVRILATHPGSDNKKLANSLHIGEHTLRNHLSRIYDKLGVPNRMELFLFTQRHGFKDQPGK